MKKGLRIAEITLFLCGHTAKEIEEMDYEFCFKYVAEKNLKLLIKINAVGFGFYAKYHLKREENTRSPMILIYKLAKVERC